MEASDAYYKTKRSLLFFIGCLFLAIFVGFKISSDEQKISVLPFSLEKPEFLTSIFAILVVFYLFQFALQWAAQRSEVQVNRFHRIDFVTTVFIGVASLLCFAGQLLKENIGLIAGLLTKPGFSVLSAIIGAVVALLSGLIALRTSSEAGRYIKATALKDDDALSRTVTSGGWFLHYNPDDPNAKKVIIFEKDGSIGTGHNQNENSWKVRNGLLEILNDQNQVFSRFAYVPSSNRFVHTNDQDTLSPRSQTISRQPQ